MSETAAVPMARPAMSPKKPPRLPQSNRSTGTPAARVSSHTASAASAAPPTAPTILGSSTAGANSAAAHVESRTTAARMMIDVTDCSAQKRIDGLVDRSYPVDRQGQLGGIGDVALRHDRFLEAERGGLFHASLHARDRADLARQPDLAHQDDVAAQRTVEVARGRGEHDPEVRGRLRHAPAPRDIDEDVLTAERHAGALFQHGQE